MPIYDYVCQQCSERIEVVHAVHATGPTICEACGGRLRKALSAPAIVFKGSGWAKVDARKASTGKPAESGAPKTSETAGDEKRAGEKPAGEKEAAARAKPAPAKDAGQPAAKDGAS